MKKQSIAIMLSAAMCFSAVPTLSSATSKDSCPQDVVCKEVTLDIQGKFEFLKEKGILRGKLNGQAHFEDVATRAQLATVLNRMFDLKTPKLKLAYSDIQNHWAQDAIQAVDYKSWFKVDSSKFSPNEAISYEELAKAFVMASGLNTDDYASIWLPGSDWAQPYLAAALTENLLSKQDDYREAATRADLTHSLYQLYQLVHQDNGGIVAGTLEPTASVEKSDDDVTWSFAVKNQTEKEQTVTFTSGKQFDYILYKDGKKVVQFSEGKGFIEIYEERSLKQGEELSYEGVLEDLTKGNYTLEIWLVDSNWPDAKKTIEFTIE